MVVNFLNCYSLIFCLEIAIKVHPDVYVHGEDLFEALWPSVIGSFLLAIPFANTAIFLLTCKYVPLCLAPLIEYYLSHVTPFVSLVSYAGIILMDIDTAMMVTMILLLSVFSAFF